MSIVELRNVSFVYGKKTPYEINALDNVSLSIEENIITGVAGLAKYLNRGTTLTQAIINSRLLERNGAQYRAGNGWNFNKKKIDELLKENPNLLKDIHIKRRKR